MREFEQYRHQTVMSTLLAPCCSISNFRDLSPALSLDFCKVQQLSLDVSGAQQKYIGKGATSTSLACLALVF